ncbi:hypothetical protein VNI00_004773 [Paramarasmius palmivorus]|uniref:Protein kinase domain-containing protein n=1 Tax=Paramarasmius palmivorus TaxID=297713 RepID=A0AAW0DJK5_9AGAR
MSSPPEPPKTPEQAKVIPKFATPHNPGSAGASENLASRNVSAIAPYHAHDLSKTKTCAIEDLFAHLLGKIRTSKVERPGKQLLDEVLALVLPLSNVVDKTASPEAFAMKQELQNYCQTKAEKERYAPFVGAANHALKALKSLRSPSTNPAPAHTADDREDALWFHVIDPTTIQPAIPAGISQDPHDGSEEDDTRRKPDIVTVFFPSISSFHPDIDLIGLDDILDICARTRPMQGTVTWEIVMSSWEFKKDKDAIVLPPEFWKGAYNLRQNTKSTIPPRQGVVKEADEYIDARKRGEKPEPSESTHDAERRASERLKRAGEKRPAGDVDIPSHESSSSKKKAVAQYPKPPAELQVAMYAAESMNSQLGRAYVLNFVVRDSRVWIWYFDREGPIQSSGFDILEDLPYFLVLLFILQRLKREDWGFVPQFGTDKIFLGGRTSDVFNVNRKEGMKAHYGLSGRCPQVVYGTFQGRHAALKLSYAEIIRTSEVAIIEEARNLLDDLPDMLACLPEILDTADFDDLNTHHIRQALCIATDGDIVPHRIPRAIVFPFYLPLVSLTSDMELFKSAFIRLMCCHAILWLRGIEHGDISVSNLMCSEGIPKLCDYDLSHRSSDERPSGLTNTGTLRFMASELLTGRAMRGKVKKVYRHDVEAFGWVLLWVLGRFRDGKQLELNEGRLFDLWARQFAVGDMQTQREDAWASISSDEGVQFPQPLSEEFKEDAILFISTLRIAHHDLNSALEKLKFPRYPSRQAIEQQVAQFRSPAFITSVLETSLVANSEYSALVKDALKVYLEKENNGQ